MAWFAAKGRGRIDKRQQGFTLIELLITLLILSILVSIVVMTMEVTKSKAQQAACKANLKTIHTAVVEYQSEHKGANPPDLDTLLTVVPPAHPGEEPTGPYLKPSFKWMCPAGNYGLQSGDYREYYDPVSGDTSCPRKNHNP